MNVSKVLFETSKKDLMASRILYKNKIYPQALFCFQQSIEKLAKSLFLLIKVADEEEIEKIIKHNPLKVLNLLKEKNKEIQKEKEEILEALPELKEGVIFSDFSSEIVTINKKDMKILQNRNVPLTEIEQVLHEIKVYKEKLKIIADKISKNGIKIFFDEEYIKRMIKESQLIANKFPNKAIYKKYKNEESAKLFFNSLAFYLIQIFLLFIPIYYLSYITISLAINTRYPDYERNFNPLEYYDFPTPLVIRYMDIYNCQKDNLSLMEKLQELSKDIMEFLD